MCFLLLFSDFDRLIRPVPSGFGLENLFQLLSRKKLEPLKIFTSSNLETNKVFEMKYVRQSFYLEVCLLKVLPLELRS